MLHEIEEKTKGGIFGEKSIQVMIIRYFEGEENTAIEV